MGVAQFTCHDCTGTAAAPCTQGRLPPNRATQSRVWTLPAPSSAARQRPAARRKWQLSTRPPRPSRSRGRTRAASTHVGGVEAAVAAAAAHGAGAVAVLVARRGRVLQPHVVTQLVEGRHVLSGKVRALRKTPRRRTPPQRLPVPLMQDARFTQLDLQRPRSCLSPATAPPAAPPLNASGDGPIELRDARRAHAPAPPATLIIRSGGELCDALEVGARRVPLAHLDPGEAVVGAADRAQAGPGAPVGRDDHHLARVPLPLDAALRPQGAASEQRHGARARARRRSSLPAAAHPVDARRARGRASARRPRCRRPPPPFLNPRKRLGTRRTCAASLCAACSHPKISGVPQRPDDQGMPFHAPLHPRSTSSRSTTMLSGKAKRPCRQTGRRGKPLAAPPAGGGPG